MSDEPHASGGGSGPRGVGWEALRKQAAAACKQQQYEHGATLYGLATN